MATFDEFEMLSIKEMLDEVSPDEVPGCPAALILKHIRKAAIKFCRDTQWFRATLDPITVVKGIAGYQLDDVPDDIRVSSILWLKIAGRELRPDEYDLMDSGLGVEVVHAPELTVRNTLEARVILEPVRDFQTLEKQLVTRWGETIGARALYTLKKLPGRKWSDPRGMLMDAQTYHNGLIDARNEAVRDRKNISLRSTTRRFHV